ncbi:acyltransferase [Vibrio parahaemolyticus]|nr:acyltransferase [Vibrio parahaemolyticus]
MAVVLFHFDVAWLPGGFAGVDVFFVISGFLMTGIIFRGLEQENFSIFKFYVARANRIIPALAVLCFILLVFGWFYLNPIDYKALGKHAASSIGFISNVIYWRESGYFDASSHEKWLLHTWSLSAEWQFYIIYPIVLVAMNKLLSVKLMKVTILIGTVLGFIFCVFATYQWPDLAYYLLPTRAWEMMLGGVAYLYPLTLQDKTKKTVERVGLLLIVFSYLLVSKDTPWPGYIALFPVLGAFLIIQAQRSDSFITSNLVFQRLGAWSYSIYLWHWPVVVFLVYFELHNLELLGILASIALGYISYRIIESRSYFKTSNEFTSIKDLFLSKLLLLIITIGLTSSFIYTKSGLSGRESLEGTPFNQKVQEQFSGSLWQYTNNQLCLKRYPYENYEELGWWFCMQNKDNPPTILLLGNSFANQLYPGFINNEKLARHTVLSIGTCGVDAEPDLKRSRSCFGPRLEEQKLFINEIIKENDSLELVVIDGLDRDVTKETINKLKNRIDFIESYGVDVIVFTPHIRAKFHPKSCFRIPLLESLDKKDCSFDSSERNKLYEDFTPLIEEISKSNPDVLFFEQNEVFCPNGKCSYVLDGLPLHRDADHTSEYASIKLQEYFTKWLLDNYPSIF